MFQRTLLVSQFANDLSQLQQQEKERILLLYIQPFFRRELMGCCGGCGGGKPDPTKDKEKEQEKKPAQK